MKLILSQISFQTRIWQRQFYEIVSLYLGAKEDTPTDRECGLFSASQMTGACNLVFLFILLILYAFDNIRYPLKDNAQKNDRAYEVPYGLKYKSYQFHYPQIT